MKPPDIDNLDRMMDRNPESFHGALGVMDVPRVIEISGIGL